MTSLTGTSKVKIIHLSSAAGSQNASFWSLCPLFGLEAFVINTTGTVSSYACMAQKSPACHCESKAVLQVRKVFTSLKKCLAFVGVNRNNEVTVYLRCMHTVMTTLDFSF